MGFVHPKDAGITGNNRKLFLMLIKILGSIGGLRMINFLNYIYKQVTSMPPFLKWFTILLFFAGTFLLLPLPFIEYTIDGNVVSYRDFWVLGYGPVVTTLSFIMLFIAFGLVYKKTWGRWGGVFIFPINQILLFLRELIIEGDVSESLSFLGFNIAASVLLYVWLFKSKKICRWFDEASM